MVLQPSRAVVRVNSDPSVGLRFTVRVRLLTAIVLCSSFLLFIPEGETDIEASARQILHER